jgi:hypothetical protein
MLGSFGFGRRERVRCGHRRLGLYGAWFGFGGRGESRGRGSGWAGTVSRRGGSAVGLGWLGLFGEFLVKLVLVRCVRSGVSMDRNAGAESGLTNVWEIPDLLYRGISAVLCSELSLP